MSCVDGQKGKKSRLSFPISWHLAPSEFPVGKKQQQLIVYLFIKYYK